MIRDDKEINKILENSEKLVKKSETILDKIRAERAEIKQILGRY